MAGLHHLLLASASCLSNVFHIQAMLNLQQDEVDLKFKLRINFPPEFSEAIKKHGSGKYHTIYNSFKKVVVFNIISIKATISVIQPILFCSH
jgi:hypothetical protein